MLLNDNPFYKLHIVPFASKQSFSGNFEISGRPTNVVFEQLSIALRDDLSNLIPFSESFAELDRRAEAISKALEAAIDNDPLQTISHLAKYEHDTEILKDDEIIAAKQMLKKLSPKLQTEIDGLSADDLRATYVSMRESCNSTEEILFFAGILDEAKKLVTAVAPNLSDIAESVANEVILSQLETSVSQKVFSNLGSGRSRSPLLRTPQQSQGQWSFFQIPGGLFITVEGSKDEKKNMFRATLSMAHELMHAITSKLLAPDENVEANGNPQPAASLLRAIAEGIAIAFEHEAILYLLAHDYLTSEQEAEVIEYGTERLADTKSSNRFLIPKVRQELRGNDEDLEIHPSSVIKLAFSEGARIAMKLGKNGWKINDLDEILRKIMEIVQSIVDT
ncbi:MAG: hypothetical protein O2840_01985, partial [bacterium]|nr:hypothetical protein [bacterium]